MKQIKSQFLSLILFSVVLFIASCDSDDETPAPNAPVVTITGDGIENNTFEGVPGDIIDATVTVNAPGGFNTLIVKKFVNDVEETGFTKRESRGTTIDETFVYDFSYTLQQSEVDQKVHFTFDGVDEAGLTTTATLNVTTTGMPAARYTGVLLYAPLENKTSETFFSTTNGETYSMEEVLGSQENISTNIDFGYFYGVNTEATLAAPSSYPLPDYGQASWAVRNTTRIGRTSLTPGQYVEISDDDVEAISQAFEGATFGTNQQQVTNLITGEILAFETDSNKTGGSKRGLIQVKTIEAGTGSTARLEIEVLVIQ